MRSDATTEAIRRRESAGRLLRARQEVGCLRIAERHGVPAEERQHHLRALNGRIEYRWRDQDGKQQRAASPRSDFVPLMRFDLEMGEMGCADVRAQPTNSAELPLDRRRYRIPLAAGLERQHRPQRASRSAQRQGAKVLEPPVSARPQLADGS